MTPTYIDPATRPYPFCPGCSHASVFDKLERALKELDLDPMRVCIVSDIGCIGIGDKHFTTHTFHGLHGRAITYATGIKTANPDLTVVTLVGDGGVGIGGAHFLNAARRNVDITVIVANNFNFGMTGGQHSVTTPHGGRTATTPLGNPERSMDLCGLVAAAGGAFAARALVFDGDLVEIMKRAITKKGFSAVDTWELCVAYYGPSNDLGRGPLEAMLQSSGFARGVIVDRDVLDLAAEQAALADAAKARGSSVAPKPVRVGHTSTLQGQRTWLVAGSAGQKIKSSTGMLGHAAVASGLFAVQRDDHPVTVMTGHSLAELVLDTRPIDALGVDVPDDVVLLSEDGRRVAAGKIARMAPTARVYTLPALAGVDTAATVRVLDPKAVGLPPKAPLPIALLGYALLDGGLLPLAALVEAVRASLPEGPAREAVATIEAVERWMAAHNG